MLHRFLLPAMLLAGLAGPLAAQTTRPAESEKVLAARQAIARAMESINADLASDDPAVRQAAERDLIELSRLGVRVLGEKVDPDDPEQKLRALRLFEDLAAEMKLRNFLLESVPAEQREAVRAEVAKHPKPFAALMSPRTDQIIGAVESLAANPVAATPVLSWAMNHDRWEVRIAAIRAIGQMDKPDRTLVEPLIERARAMVPSEPYTLSPLDKKYPDVSEPSIRLLYEQEKTQDRVVLKALASLREPDALRPLLYQMMCHGQRILFDAELLDQSGTRLEVPFTWHRGEVTAVA